jgi:hypothetical protein
MPRLMVSKRAPSIDNPGLAESMNAKEDHIKFTSRLSSVLCLHSTLEILPYASFPITSMSARF